MEPDLKSILKALLLSTGDPLAPKDIQRLFSRFREEREQELAEQAENTEASAEESAGELPELITVTQVREAFESLQEELEAEDETYRIVEGPRGYQIACAPKFADWIRLLRQDPRPVRLTPASLETLTIIAYRQPVTRAEMETIRGVSVDSALSKLLELELVHVLGRAELPGRPIQYGVTDHFLEFAGIKSLEELPASDIISTHNLDSWLRELSHREPVSDEDVGLPAEDFYEESETVTMKPAPGFSDDDLNAHSS